jgi:hypothetical protein
VAPFDHAKVPEQAEAVSVTVWPLHRLVLPEAVMVGVAGVGLTVTATT